MCVNCFYHPDQTAVAVCSQCGKGLCQACASKWEPLVCEDCGVANAAALQKKRVQAIIAGLVIFYFVGRFYAVGTGSAVVGVISGYLASGIPSGWVAMRKYQPRGILLMPIIGWIMYFITKVCIAYFVGIVAWPVNIYKTIKGAIESKSYSAQ
jgi:hypothetical protein